VEVLETLMRVAESGALPKASWDVPVQRIVQVKRDHFRQSRKVNRAHARELIGAREHLRISRRLRDELVKAPSAEVDEEDVDD